jgi:hypothetical protein
MSEENKNQQAEDSADNFELLTGLVIAIFAAVLSLNGLGGGKFGGDEAIANIDKSNQYSWFQSKSIKKTLAEGKVTDLETQLEMGAVADDKKELIEKLLSKYKSKVEKYDHETKIILDGSSTYEKEAWFSTLDDDMKAVIGAKEHEQKASGLNDAGDIFDYGELFLQLCLVLGAVSLVIKKERLKRVFFGSMIVGGAIGTVFTFMAFQAAWKFL